MRLLSALFCPATAAVCLGKTFWDSKLTAWIKLRHTGRSTAPCTHETACVRARTQYVAQTIVPSRSHRHDVPEVEFKKKTPILATLRDFERLVRHETSICRVLQFPSRPRCHGVTLVRKLRFTALYWPSNGVSLQKRRPKLEASADDHPSTIFKILFFSIVARHVLRHIASTTRTAMPCAPRSHLASGDRDRDG